MATIGQIDIDIVANTARFREDIGKTSPRPTEFCRDLGGRRVMTATIGEVSPTWSAPPHGWSPGAGSTPSTWA